MPRLLNPEMEYAPFLLLPDQSGEQLKSEMIHLEQKMAAMLNSRDLPGFFKTPDEINADFYRKSATMKTEYTSYSDTLDGCMNIQQSLFENKGYMEENY